MESFLLQILFQHVEVPADLGNPLPLLLFQFPLNCLDLFYVVLLIFIIVVLVVVIVLVYEVPNLQYAN